MKVFPLGRMPLDPPCQDTWPFAMHFCVKTESSATKVVQNSLRTLHGVKACREEQKTNQFNSIHGQYLVLENEGLLHYS